MFSFHANLGKISARGKCKECVPFSFNNEKGKKTSDIVWQDADDVAEVEVHTNDIGDVHENI